MLQNSQLNGDVAHRLQENERLREELDAVKRELESQIALHFDFEAKLTAQTNASQLEIKHLQDTLAAASKQHTPGSKVGEENEAIMHDLEAQLAHAERSMKVLAAEKLQMLEAYELLEEDTGRLIDAAVAKQQKRTTELGLQLEARFSLPCGLPPPHRFLISSLTGACAVYLLSQPSGTCR